MTRTRNGGPAPDSMSLNLWMGGHAPRVSAATVLHFCSAWIFLPTARPVLMFNPAVEPLRDDRFK